MNLKTTTLTLLIALLIAPFSALMAQETKTENSGPVFVIPINGEINSPLLYFVRRSIKQAESQKARAVILEMDTPGGRLDICLKIMDLMSDFKGQTITYVKSDALSAGALISISTQKIYMAPKAVIGASAPVMSGGQDVPETANDKIISVLKAKARSFAKINGYDQQLVEAFIDKDTEVIIAGKIVNKKGDLLTLTADEATEKLGPDKKPLLATGVFTDIEALQKDLFADAQIIQMTPTGAEQVAFWINMISPLLILGGILGIYIEFKTPGFGLFGVIGIICFLIYFAGLFVAGLSGYEPIILFCLGIILIIIELFIWPGHILPGFLGVCLILVAVVYGGAEKQPQITPDEAREMRESAEQADDPSKTALIPLPSIDSFQKPILDLFLGVVGAILGMILLSKYLPKTSIYHRLILSSPSGPLPPEYLGTDDPARVGNTGMSETALHPTGKARFESKLLDVVTQGEMIPEKTPVVIIKKEGFKILVRALP